MPHESIIVLSQAEESERGLTFGLNFHSVLLSDKSKFCVCVFIGVLEKYIVGGVIDVPLRMVRGCKVPSSDHYWLIDDKGLHLMKRSVAS